MRFLYSEQDGDLTLLNDKTIAIVGYGNLGKPAAHNLRDSDVRLIVCGTELEQNQAHDDGFQVGSVAHATRQADIIILTLPDETMPQIYMSDISPNLKRGHTLIFNSAYNITFGFIEPPPFVDVALIAPRTIGDTLRESMTQDKSIMSYVAVWQDASRHAWQIVLAMARALGALKGGALEVGIQQETELSLFIQQAILPAFHHIITTAARLLMSEGYPVEAVLTDLYLSGKFTDYIHQAARSGLMHALSLSGQTGQYGTLSRMERFNELKLERLMEVTLEDIRNGNFAREWSREQANGKPRLNKLLKQHQSQDLWDLEQQVLEMKD
ncbi:MAG: hypothetical protein CUN56_10975 [Phototrophicales bacterium]|nr:MAG: hypothetical protein CUN56_10975 [Phototrophicales bacterium]RMG71422.1 MAG: hypothetical protein D6711_15440 [Chloroflexota bacterium]